MLFAVIGWVALFALGAYIACMGLLGGFACHAFGGRVEWPAIVLSAVGLGIIGACIYFAPFVVTVGVR